MKLTKLMLSASVAALALVSCNKQDTTPEAPKRLKTVEISLENAALTKGLAGSKIEAGDAVVLNDFKIFLTDGSGNEYSAKVADGSADAKTYWNTADLADGAIEASFHYVDPNCTKVVAVGNLGDDLTFAEYKALANLKVGEQQEQDKLVLYDVKDLVKASGQHTDQNVNGTTYVSDVYEAELVLTPRISRFEVDGFTVKFNSTPKYQNINVTQIAFQNYYPETSVTTGVESGELVNHIKDLANQSEVYTWLDTPVEGTTPWYRDYFDITITPSAATKDTPKPLAYHVFSSDAAPVMVIKLLADGQPAYLYSKGFYKTDGTPVTAFEEGKIYRMSAKGEVENDGSIPIDEDDIDPMDRCLEITVDVIDWAVELVYPEF
ncbi:MAG: hypothetical protein IKW20_05155 [Bacteroidales bacterium]|nr:hypothetical protein [Bacteroidales bacterium]